MLRGYRFLIAASCGLVLFVALGTGAFFGSLYSPGHKQYNVVAGDQSGQSDYTGPSQSLPDISGLPGPVERAIANPHPNTGHDNEKRDLAAQEASALWAFWMVVAPFASVLITALGTIFLYKQIVLTREAVEDTGKATKAMERQNEIAADTAYRQLRAYLTPGDAEMVIGMKGDLNLFFRLKGSVTNSGLTPAIITDERSFTRVVGGGGGGFESRNMAEIVSPRSLHTVTGEFGFGVEEVAEVRLQVGYLFTYTDYMGAKWTETVWWRTERILPMAAAKAVPLILSGHHSGPHKDLKWSEDEWAEIEERAREIKARQAQEESGTK